VKGGKVGRLNDTIIELAKETKGRIEIIVVTTDRGLIVAGSLSDRASNETLAAMASLISETSIRVCNNMEMDRPKSTTIKTKNATIILIEFLVVDRWFRLGAKISKSGTRRYGIFRKQLTFNMMEEKLYKMSGDISRILRRV
jgi:predicted regulator of Ras-like GTPase activity (Roadblock/LC7/MglB family)